MDYQQGFRDGFAAGMAQAMSTPPMVPPSPSVIEEPPTRKPSTYNRKYAAAYRRIKRKNTLKNGSMRKGFGGKRGHLKIVKMAHAEVKRGMKK